MESKKQAVIAPMLYCVVIALMVLSSPAQAEDTPWIVLHENIPQEIERFTIPLKFEPSSSYFFDMPQQEIKSEDIKAAVKKEDYKKQLNAGTLIDGCQYTIQVKDASELNVINQSSDRLCIVRVLRTKENKKPEIVKEGLCFLNNNFGIPLEISPSQAAVPSEVPVKGQLEITIYLNDSVYTGRCRTTLNGSLSGSATAQKTFLNATITCGNSLNLKTRNLALSLKPFSDQSVPASCNGVISDVLMLGSAKIVVEKIASDSSQLVLALLDGTLEQPLLPTQKIVMAEVGKPFPAFARVELVKRHLLTLDNLKKEAGDGGYVVLIFADFKRESSPYFGGRPYIRNLSLDEKMISDMLKKDCEKPIILAFVCQQVSISDIYEKWLGRDLDFLVLSDFSNPLFTLGSTGMPPGMMMMRNSPQTEETLRGSLKFDNEKIITVLIDGSGNTVYLNTDAGKELAGSLVQINNLMREDKKPEKKE